MAKLRLINQEQFDWNSISTDFIGVVEKLKYFFFNITDSLLLQLLMSTFAHHFSGYFPNITALLCFPLSLLIYLFLA